MQLNFLTDWMVLPEKACKIIGKENSKSVFGVYGLQSICTDQESVVLDLASHLCIASIMNKLFPGQHRT